MTGKAILTKIELLPDQVQAYTYTLDPPTIWEGTPYRAKGPHVVPLETVTIVVGRGETQLYAQGKRFQCRGRLGGSSILPDEFLPAFCGYEETVLSKMQRLLNSVEVPDKPPPTLTGYLSYAWPDLWPQLSDETRMVIAALVQAADGAVGTAKKRTSWEDDDEWGDDDDTEEGESESGDLSGIRSELRAIRRLLENRL